MMTNGTKPAAGLGPLPVGILTVANGTGVACTGIARRYEPIKLLPDGEHHLYDMAALDAAVAAERDLLAALCRRQADESDGDVNYRDACHDCAAAIATCRRVGL